MSLHEERGAMVVDDVRRLPRWPLVVAEGSTVSPEVVSSGVAVRSQALWLMPTEQVQQRQLDERGTQPPVYYARPWAQGDVETVMRAFLCECGEPDCTAWVEVTVGAASEPVFTPGHAVGHH